MAVTTLHQSRTIGQLLRATDDGVRVLEASASARDGAREMLSSDVPWLLVVNHKRTVGVVTWRELVTLVADGPRPDPAPNLGELASPAPLSVEDTALLEDVRHSMLERDLRYATVRRNARVVGLLTTRDVLQHRLEVQEHVTEELAAYIARDYPR